VARLFTENEVGVYGWCDKVRERERERERERKRERERRSE